MVFTGNHTLYLLKPYWLRITSRVRENIHERRLFMTNNQIRYFQLQEDILHNRNTEAEQKRFNTGTLYEQQRSHLAQEAETQRSNRAREKENERTNRANERLKLQSNLIQSRYITEQGRHNLAGEQLQAYSNETDRMRVQASYAQMASNERAASIAASANRYAADVNARTQAAYLAETNRSNLATEAEINRANMARESETARSNKAREQETKRSNIASNYTASRNASANQQNADTRRSQFEFDRSVYATTGADLQKSQTFSNNASGYRNIAQTVSTGVDTVNKLLNLVGTYGGPQSLLGGAL